MDIVICWLVGVSLFFVNFVFIDLWIEKILIMNFGVFDECDCDVIVFVFLYILFIKMGVVGVYFWVSLGFDWWYLKNKGCGMVVLENFLNYGILFCVGDFYFCKSLIYDVGCKSISFCYFLFNLLINNLYMYIEIMVVLFDLEMRKLVELIV